MSRYHVTGFRRERGFWINAGGVRHHRRAASGPVLDRLVHRAVAELRAARGVPMTVACWKRENRSSDRITRHWLGCRRMVRKASEGERRAYGGRVLVFEFGKVLRTAETVADGKRIAEEASR